MRFQIIQGAVQSYGISSMRDFLALRAYRAIHNQNPTPHLTASGVVPPAAADDEAALETICFVLRRPMSLNAATCLELKTKHDFRPPTVGDIFILEDADGARAYFCEPQGWRTTDPAPYVRTDLDAAQSA
jgi:hypothetical protein